MINGPSGFTQTSGQIGQKSKCRNEKQAVSLFTLIQDLCLTRLSKQSLWNILRCVGNVANFTLRRSFCIFLGEMDAFSGHNEHIETIRQEGLVIRKTIYLSQIGMHFFPLIICATAFVSCTIATSDPSKNSQSSTSALSSVNNPSSGNSSSQGSSTTAGSSSVQSFMSSSSQGSSVMISSSSATSSIAVSSSVTISSSIALSSVALSSSGACTNTYGTNKLIDCRDGQVYKTVVIGTQVWMAQNLNYMPTKTSGNSWCYNDSVSLCATYGRLYDYPTAMTACPSGWHLPDTTEWNTLEAAVGGAAVAGSQLSADSSHWQACSGITRTNAFGFNGLPEGYYWSVLGGFRYLLADAYWWTSISTVNSSAYSQSTNYCGSNMYRGAESQADGISIRCLKN